MGLNIKIEPQGDLWDKSKSLFYTIRLSKRHRFKIKVLGKSRFRLWTYFWNHKEWGAVAESFLIDNHRVPDKYVPYVEAMLMGASPFMVFRKMMKDVK